MNKVEAKEVADSELAKFKLKEYEKLMEMIDFSESKEHELDSGKYYQTQIKIYWNDSKVKNEIRIVCLVDDGGWTAFMPKAFGYTIHPDGKICEY